MVSSRQGSSSTLVVACASPLPFAHCSSPEECILFLDDVPIYYCQKLGLAMLMCYLQMGCWRRTVRFTRTWSGLGPSLMYIAIIIDHLLIVGVVSAIIPFYCALCTATLLNNWPRKICNVFRGVAANVFQPHRVYIIRLVLRSASWSGRICLGWMENWEWDGGEWWQSRRVHILTTQILWPSHLIVIPSTLYFTWIF